MPSPWTRFENNGHSSGLPGEVMKATDTHAASRATRRAIGSLVVALTWLCGETAHAYDADYFTYRSDSLMHQQMLRNMARSVDRSRQLAHKGQGASAAPGSASTVIPLGTTPSLPARVAAKVPGKGTRGSPASSRQPDRKLRQTRAALRNSARRPCRMRCCLHRRELHGLPQH